MGKAVRHHRVAAALQRELEPFERITRLLALVIVPGDEAGLIEVVRVARVVLESAYFRIGDLVRRLVMQVGTDPRARDVDGNGRKLAATLG